MFRFLITLAVCLVLVSASDSLKKQHQEKVISATKQVLDREFQAALKARDSLHEKLSPDAKMLKEMEFKSANHSSLRKTKEIEENDQRRLSQYSEKGYMITRFRPNSDCTGRVSGISGQIVGQCTYLSESSSYKNTCKRELDSNGQVEDISVEFLFYSTPDCSGMSTLTHPINSFPKCSMDVPNYFTSGPRMVSYQCAPDMSVYEGKKGDLMLRHYTDFECSSAPMAFSSLATGNCYASVDMGRNQFNYLTVECISKTEIQSKFFTDPGCSRTPEGVPAEYFTTIMPVSSFTTFSECTDLAGLYYQAMCNWMD